MSPSIAVFGAGPGLGQAVARRYANEGYDTVVIARRLAPLQALAASIVSDGGRSTAIAADLSDLSRISSLAEEVREAFGDPDVVYYGLTPTRFTAALDVTPENAASAMNSNVLALIGLVDAFLPGMLERGHGAILAGSGASALKGMAGIALPGVALAAQRNYLQTLQSEVAERGIHVAQLFVAAVIENSAFHASADPARDTVDPDRLAELLFTSHRDRGPHEQSYPSGLVG